MLINPYQAVSMPVVPGTRMLQQDFGLAGYQLVDPGNSERLWTVSGLYTPVGRKPNGIRVKLIDNKRFITFCNQRDFEVLLGIAKPGDWCHWAGEEYCGPDDANWFGFWADSLDLCDDLHERELELLGECQHGQKDWFSLSIERRIHSGGGSDAEDMWIPNTQPIEDTVNGRWIRVFTQPIDWKKTI
jgi:hypothetical protein